MALEGDEDDELYRLGPSFLPTGWGESFLRPEFAGVDALLSAWHGRDGAVGLDFDIELVNRRLGAPR